MLFSQLSLASNHTREVDVEFPQKHHGHQNVSEDLAVLDVEHNIDCEPINY